MLGIVPRSLAAIILDGFLQTITTKCHLGRMPGLLMTQACLVVRLPGDMFVKSNPLPHMYEMW